MNHSINNSTFLEQLRLEDVNPVFKKNSRTDEDNYRPVSILPNISKIYDIFSSVNIFKKIILKLRGYLLIVFLTVIIPN